MGRKKTLTERSGATEKAARWARCAVLAGIVSGIAVPLSVTVASACAQTTARASGTVKSIAGNVVTILGEGGASTTVTLAGSARIQRSADLKTLSPASLSDLAVGDKVLVTGTSTDGGWNGTRLIMIKSATIQERNAASEADWAKRGSGGIVQSVDAGSNAITIGSGKRNVTVAVTGATVYRRYAPGSVKFEDAKPGTLAEIHPGDQLRVRGDKSPDGGTITADEIVSGSFRNLSGTVVSVNAAANSLVIKDLATKKNETVSVGDATDLRALPPMLAAHFGNGGAGHRAGQPGAAQSAAVGAGQGAAGGEGRGSSSAGVGASAGSAGHAGGRGDLASLIPRLPRTTLSALKPGDALMIVASGDKSGGSLTAITVLSGVEPLLTGPAGSGMTLSPWNLGSGGGEGAGGGSE